MKWRFFTGTFLPNIIMDKTPDTLTFLKGINHPATVIDYASLTIVITTLLLVVRSNVENR